MMHFTDIKVICQDQTRFILVDNLSVLGTESERERKIERERKLERERNMERERSGTDRERCGNERITVSLPQSCMNLLTDEVEPFS